MWQGNVRSLHPVNDQYQGSIVWCSLLIDALPTCRACHECGVSLFNPTIVLTYHGKEMVYVGFASCSLIFHVTQYELLCSYIFLVTDLANQRQTLETPVNTNGPAVQKKAPPSLTSPSVMPFSLLPSIMNTFWQCSTWLSRAYRASMASAAPTPLISLHCLRQ